MAKREKRLEKGIESLKKRIEEHKEKREKAKKEGKQELENYYVREIEAKIEDLEKKQRQRDRKK